MKKIILSIAVAAFAAVAAQAGSDGACCAAKQQVTAKADSDGACCGAKQVAAQAKGECPMAAKQAKLNAKNAKNKQVVTKEQLKSPKAFAEVRG